MQYQVPQFIELEDKIFGPLTLKQFIYLAGGGGLCLLFFTTLPLYFAIPVSLPVAGLSLALAFYKVNDRPFIIALEHAFSYQFGSKLYLWKQREVKPQAPVQAASASATTAFVVPKLSQSKLKDLAWSLNVKDREKMGMTNSQNGDFAI